MSYFDPPRDYRGPGLMETLFGWLVGMIAMMVAFGILIELISPLLPWIGAAFALGLGVRWWLYRTSNW